MKNKKTGKFKKLLAAVLTAVMILSAVPLSGIADIDLSEIFAVKASAENSLAPTGQCGDNVYWTFDESTGLLTISGTGDMKDYSYNGMSPFYYNSLIKRVVIEKDVTSIGDHAFYDCYRLTSVTIPDSVTSIGEDAFYYCTGLTSVTIGNSVTSIGSYAFRECTGLTSVTIPDSVTSIGSGVFSNCTGLTSVTIPDSVTSIGSGVFSNCTGLTSVTIGNSVTIIGSYAFESCAGLTSVTIPDSVTSIGYGAFRECTGLTSVTIGNSVKSIGEGAFYNCGSLTSVIIDKNNNVYDSRNNCNAIIKTQTNTLISGCKNTIIPDSVTSIGNYAFESCAGLTSVTIPDSVTSIGNYAFRECTGLTSVTIPDSVTSIGYGAFRECTGLTSVTIGNSVTSIYSGAFYNTAYYNDSVNWQNHVLYIGNYLIQAEESLSGSYIIKTGTTVIADGAFESCAGLTSITIPESVTSIDNSAFESCTGLTSVTIPDSVTSIGSGVFSDCTGLTSVTIGNSVTSIGGYAFAYCEGLTSVTIPDSVTSIGGYAFLGCNSLADITVSTGNTKYDSRNNCNAIIETKTNKLLCGCKNTVIPNGIEEIESYAFSGCTDLKKITIPNSVTDIGEYAFSKCSCITEISVPDSVKSIGNCAFSECSALSVIKIPDNISGIEWHTFDNTEYYNNESNWTNGILYLGNYLLDAKDTVSGKVNIKPGVKYIPNSLFYGCENIVNISIPDSVTDIGYSAFSNTGYYNDKSNWENGVLYIDNCLIDSESSLKGDYIIKPGTRVIAGYAFNFNKNLTSIAIPDSVVSIGLGAFSDCTGLTGITIPNSVTSIGNHAFSGCSGITEITIPDGVLNIGSGAFSGTNILSLFIPSSVKSLGEGGINGSVKISVDKNNENYSSDENGVLFNKDKTELISYPSNNTAESYVIPEGVEIIKYRAFWYKQLKEIYIPKSLTEMEACVGNKGDAYEAERVQVVHYAGSESDWNRIQIRGGNIGYWISSYYKITYNSYPFDEAQEYTITYNGNGGRNVPEGQTKKKDVDITLSAKIPAKDGYKFLGWSTDKNAASPQYNAGAKITANENLTLYAVWQANSYTVKFYDGSTLLGSKTLKYDETSTLSYGKIPEKKGCKFLGWSTVNGGPALFSDGQSIKGLANTDGAVVCYYAAWEKQENSVVTDKSTGIIVDIPGGTYDENVELKVEKVLSGSAFDIIENQVDGLKTSIFSIETFVDGVKTQPDGFVTVKIPVPQGFNASKCKLYYVNTDKGIAESISFEIKDGYIVFSTNHFSDWAVVETKGQVKSVNASDIEIKYKNTGKINPEINVDNGVKYTVEYKSSDTSVATVDKDGNITTMHKGSTTITCTVTDEYGNTVSDTCTVTVKLQWWQRIIWILLLGFIWY